MTTGTLKTQGTDLFFSVPQSSSEIHKVQCATAVGGLGGAANQIDKTCLSSQEKEFERGLLNPGPLNVPFNVIFRSAAHQALIALRDSGETTSWMIVFSDQTADPTALDSAGRLVSPGATTAEFLGYIADMTFDAQMDDIVRGTLTVQRSGAAVWDLPTADLD